ncbi:MAG: MetQ/NlpA family ABC transporter substrate-binding protein [Eubacteriales bacterium]|nr:MetQ/NlpA family ABC transporter substrate-binding protein [Lachnospiraceae bacterium]MDO4417106.1 MetQ/NlpA family ABC transporter substrate-binding protein [Eubacteriales bacterium]
MKRKVMAAVLAGILAAGVLAGCGGSSSAGSAAPAQTEEAGEEEAPAAGTAAAQEAEAETAQAPEDNHITVAASPTPHAEILAQVKPILEAQGYELEVVEFEDYVQPNNVVDSGEIDANYFQHINYLEDFNANHGTDLAIAGRIHYEPFGIYPGTKASLDEIADGDTIAIPNDPTNEARALLLLEANGIITLKEGAGITATVNDIESKSVDVQLNEVEAAQVSRYKDEMSYMILNGNYALAAGIKAGSDALALEQGDSEAIKEQYVNVIAVKAGNEELPKIKALVGALQSEEVRAYIEEHFEGAVVPY